MIKVEKVKVFNFEGAIRGMRNPLNSWIKSDSHFDYPSCDSCPYYGKEDCSLFDCVVIGKNDLDLMQRLYRGGTEHRKYLRQIFVTMDIVAPRFFYTEMDTYKVGTTANSCSTMHTIHKRPFTIDDFSLDKTTITNKKVEQKIIPIIVDVEKWKEIQSIPNVLVSNTGRVKTKPYEMRLQDGRVRHYPEKEIAILNDVSNGYQNVSIHMYGERYHCKLHRLMAEAFLPTVKGKSCINHKDGNKLNNNLSNLEWVSYSENRQHAIDNSLVFWCDESRKNIGDNSRLLNNVEICEILKMRISGSTLEDIANLKNIPKTTVCRVCNGQYFTRNETPMDVMNKTIDKLNELRELYLKTNNKIYWRMMIEMLPQSYNQRRTITMNYENIMNIINQREHHKLDEWVEFVKILKELPYVKEIRGEA